MWWGIVPNLYQWLILLMQSLDSKMDLIKDNCLSLKLLGSKTARLLFPRSDPKSKPSSFTICSKSTNLCEHTLYTFNPSFLTIKHVFLDILRLLELKHRVWSDEDQRRLAICGAMLSKPLTLHRIPMHLSSCFCSYQCMSLRKRHPGSVNIDCTVHPLWWCRPKPVIALLVLTCVGNNSTTYWFQ